MYTYRCSVFLLESDTNELVAKVFDGGADDKVNMNSHSSSFKNLYKLVSNRIIAYCVLSSRDKPTVSVY